MNEFVGVECTVEKDGKVRLRRIELGDRWLVVEQGRQWIDEDGRHVLIMIPGGKVEEILLSSRSLQWELVARRGDVSAI